MLDGQGGNSVEDALEEGHRVVIAQEEEGKVGRVVRLAHCVVGERDRHLEKKFANNEQP